MGNQVEQEDIYEKNTTARKTMIEANEREIKIGLLTSTNKKDHALPTKFGKVGDIPPVEEYGSFNCLSLELQHDDLRT